MEEATKTTSQLVSALAKAKLEFKPIKKTAKNPFYHSKYAPLEELIACTQEALANQGLVVMQTTKVSMDAEVLITTLMHESGEKIVSETRLPDQNKLAQEEAERQKNESKLKAYNYLQEEGKARTYKRRYEYAAMLGLAAEDDDDDGNQRQQQQATPAQQATGKGKGSQPSKPQEAPKSTPHSAYFGAIAGVFDTEEARHDWQDMVTKKESESDWGSAEYDLAKAAVPMAQSGAIKRLLEGTDYTGADDPAFLEMIGRKAILFDREMASKGIEHLSIADRTMVIKLLAPQKAINTLLKSTEYKDIADPKFLESLTKYFEKQVDSIESLNLEERAKVIRSLANKKKNGNGGAK